VTTVVGIDPGGTTGVATLMYYRDSGWLVVPRQYGQANALTETLDLLSRANPDAVAVERFIVSNRSARSRSSGAGEFARELIGALQYTGCPLDRRTASQVKRWATDKRLSAAGLLEPTKGMPHARDATRHALFSMVHRKWAPDPLSRAEV